MRARLHRLRQLAGTTPGRLTMIATALVLISLEFGLVAVLAVQHRADLVRDVGGRSGPLSFQAQSIYRSLSDADATAANAFLAGGVEPVALRQRYADNVARASAALTASLRVADAESAARLATLNERLPVYTGLIETARANNRRGVPLGAAYLREASWLMQHEMLPVAKELFESEADRLAATQRDATAFPWTVVVLGLATLVGLVAAQVFVTRRTNRLINVGLAGATIATLGSLAWATLTLTGAATQIDVGRRDGSAQLRLLAETRAAALQARAAESLTLIARGAGAGYEEDFVTMRLTLVGADGAGGLLAQAISQSPTGADRRAAEQARQHAQRWFAVHEQLRRLDEGGRYTEAVKLATEAGPDSPSTLFNQLDEALTRSITGTNVTFDSRAAGAGRVLAGADAAVIAFTALLAVGAVVGLQRRIREYL